MKKVIAAVIGILCLVVAANAQKSIPERLLLTTGQYVGTGARAMGLAGTYTGIADDYSSVWWNPAGLAQIKRIELQGSLSRSSYGNKTEYYGGKRDGSTNSLRLNNVGVVFPVPVYQGALTFAFGYNQISAFDRRARVLSGTPGDETHAWDNFDELESGRLGMWTFAGAVDVSQNLALGLGINYWTGMDEYDLTGTYSDRGSHYQVTSVNTDLSAWGVNVGGLFHIGRYARLGMMLQSPMSMSLSEEWSVTEDNTLSDGFFDYKMTYPAVMRMGASFSPGRWLIAADIEYRDWTSLEFRSDTPYLDINRAEANQQIKDTYQSTTRYSVGGEYLFPSYGLRARLGYSFEPSNYKDAGGQDDRNIIAGGLGLLVDRSVMLDAAVQHTSYTEKVTTGLKEDISNTSALITISYRM
jgi:long-chain fatty acid transport protein